MKKVHFFLLVMLVTVNVYSQKSETADMETGQNTSGVMSGALKEKQQIVLNTRDKSADNTVVLDITGIGGLTYSSLNISNATSRLNSYELKITLSLLTGASKNTGYDLVFLPDSKVISSAVEKHNGVVQIFYPMVTYERISEKLAEAIAAKKKVQLKIIQGKDGFNEASLFF